MKSLILIGGGGHCISCIDVIRSTGMYTIIGILDTAERKGTELMGIPFIGTDDDIPALKEQADLFLITVGQIKTAAVRKKLFDAVKNAGASLATIISPHAYVSKDATIGAGSIVMHHAIVNASSSVDVNCIINTRALLEHGVSVGMHAHIATGAILNGDVVVGNENFIGSNAVLIQGVQTGSNCIVGAGSVLLNSLPDEAKVYGNPAQAYA